MEEPPKANGVAPEPSPSPEAESKEGGEEKKPEEEKKEGEGEGETKAEEAKEGGEEKKEEAEEPKKKKRKRIEKRYEWVDVVKKKRRTKRTDLAVVPSGLPGLDAETMQTRRDEETQMQVEMREIIETQERKNDLESYILTMRSKCAKEDVYGPFLADKDRDKFLEDLMKAEDWVHD